MIDLNGFFIFLGCVSLCIMVLGCFAIYYGVRFRRGGEDIEIVSGRYEQERLSKERRDHELAEELSTPPIEEDEDDRNEGEFDAKKNQNRNKKTFH